MLLTLEQIAANPKGKVYLEYRHPEYTSGYREASWIKAWIGKPNGKHSAQYGRTWRCWSEKPSEEECVEWEGDVK